MKKIILSSLVCASMMLATDEYKYEVTPMIGGAYTEGNLGLEKNYVNAGLALGFNQTDSVIDQVEFAVFKTIKDVELINSSADTRITRVFVNFVKDYPLTANTSLYALAGAGVEFFEDAISGKHYENGLVGNYGVGAKYKLAEDLALKFDVRHLIETDSGDNTLLYNLGITIPFGKTVKAVPVVAAPVVTPIIVTPKDSDNDGVIDAKDNCPNTIAGAEVDNVGCMTIVDLKINFESDSAVIKDDYNSRIVNFANAMKNNTKLKATIEAHTDSTASKKYNQELSEKRAQSTIEALKKLNIAPSRLSAIGYGETQPISTNTTKEGRAENRRVIGLINQ